jgi:hypothetical protein
LAAGPPDRVEATTNIETRHKSAIRKAGRSETVLVSRAVTSHNGPVTATLLLADDSVTIQRVIE